MSALVEALRHAVAHLLENDVDEARAQDVAVRIARLADAVALRTAPEPQVGDRVRYLPQKGHSSGLWSGLRAQEDYIVIAVQSDGLRLMHDLREGEDYYYAHPNRLRITQRSVLLPEVDLE